MCNASHHQTIQTTCDIRIISDYPNSIRLGSSMYSLTFTRNVTASLPSNRRWSYVSARYIICEKVSKLSRNANWSKTYWSDLNLAVDYHSLVLDSM